MKIVDDNMLDNLKKNALIKDDTHKTIPFTSDETSIKALEEYDKLKSKVLKYVVYKKRSESEIRKKFQDIIDEETLDSIISDLKDNNYIDDKVYIKRAINEFMALKTLSLYEMKNKLLAKGINGDLIDSYFDENREELAEYELNSCKRLLIKKSNSKDEQSLINYLYHKGYSSEVIKQAIEEL